MAPGALAGCEPQQGDPSSGSSTSFGSSGTGNTGGTPNNGTASGATTTDSSPSSEDTTLAPEVPGVLPEPLPSGPFEEIRADTPRDPAPQVTREELNIVRMASDDLGFELFRRLSRGHDKNVVFSPASMFASLGQVLAASSGETEQELLALMGPGLESERVHRAVSRLEMQAFSNQEQASSDMGALALRYINRLFVPKGTQPDPGYLDLLARRYGTGVFGVELDQGGEAARAKINGWVGEQTQTRVDSLWPEGSMNDSATLRVVSALDFKAPWQKCLFCSGKTKENHFFLRDGTRLTLPVQEAYSWDTRSGHEGDYSWLSFGLGRKSLRLYILLPFSVRFEETAAGLTAANFRKWAKDGERCADKLEIPMFELRSPSVDLRPHLKELGLKRLFGENGHAELGGIGASGQSSTSRLSSFMHQVSFALGRGGLEGGQGPTQIPETLPEPEIEPCGELWTSGPFYFVVYDEASQLVQLVGRVMDPTKN